MTHQVELSDEVYQKIQQAAEKQGITPAEWIAATVFRVGAPISADNEHPADGRPLREVLQGLVGSFDSSTEPHSERHINPMAEMVADKLQKQGIEVPWRRQR